MKNIDWVRKLTSRKLWTAAASFVSMMIVATGGSESSATQVTALIMAGASVIAYTIMMVVRIKPRQKSKAGALLWASLLLFWKRRNLCIH